MIVSELIKFLESMPQDAIVEVIKHSSDGGYYMQGGSCKSVDFDGVDFETYEFTDFTKNSLIKEDHPYFGKKVLLLGVYE